jgi:GH24 family phage-related lysozyme (muramidase)
VSNPAPITLEQLFRHKRPWGQLPHQDAAIIELEEDLNANPYSVVMRRDRPWFKTWSVDGKLHDPVTLAKPLVQSFEGCHLTAYPDPGTKGEPWTIGWGSTTYASGKPVRPGDTITQQMADELLDMRLRNDLLHLAKVIPRWASLSAHQQAALLSFSYNVGRNWYGGDGFATITARLRDGLLDQVDEAMKLYINPGSDVEAGLKRRREAEGRMWRGEGLPATSPATGPSKVPPHLSLTRTKRKDANGLELLALRRIRDGIPMGEVLVVSGAPGKQVFATGARSKAQSLTPLPEGRYRLGPVEWKGGEGNWSTHWDGPRSGLGPVWIDLIYEAPGRTARSAIGFHLDANAPVAPGSAGCVVFRTRADLETLLGWLKADGPALRHLFVNWGLGTCPAPKPA